VVKENVPVSLRIVIKLLYFHMQLMYLYVTWGRSELCLGRWYQLTVCRNGIHFLTKRVILGLRFIYLFAYLTTLSVAGTGLKYCLKVW
jgi:hypothetical protein